MTILNNATNNSVIRLRSTLEAMRIGREKDHAAWMADFVITAHLPR